MKTPLDNRNWVDALEFALKNSYDSVLIVEYGYVAKAFPSVYPHSRTFEHSRIDDDALRQWSLERGWDAGLAPEVLPEGSENLPPVKFWKIDH